MLAGGMGADNITGGGGNDIMWIDAEDTFIDGGLGFDVVFVEGPSGVTIDLFESRVQVIYGGIGDDVITMSGGDYSVRVLGSVGDDRITTGRGDDHVEGGPGDDAIDGGNGTDTVTFVGDLAEYKIVVETVDEQVTITITDLVEDRDDNDGTDVLINVEKLIFNDQTRTLDGRNNAPVIPPIAKRIMRNDPSKPFRLEPYDLLTLCIEFDGEELSLAGVGPATNARIVILPNRSMIFEPEKDFVGEATLEFVVEDPTGAFATGVLRFIVLPSLPADPLFNTQWHHDAIRSPAVWDSGITGKGVKVRVNDDALEVGHEDLAAQVDVENSEDYTNKKKSVVPDADDENHHGTFVTGCIVAARNNIGIIGVAYNAIARFSMSFGLGPADDADVINLSWSSRPSYEDEKKIYRSGYVNQFIVFHRESAREH